MSPASVRAVPSRRWAAVMAIAGVFLVSKAFLLGALLPASTPTPHRVEAPAPGARDRDPFSGARMGLPTLGLGPQDPPLEVDANRPFLEPERPGFLSEADDRPFLAPEPAAPFPLGGPRDPFPEAGPRAPFPAPPPASADTAPKPRLQGSGEEILAAYAKDLTPALEGRLDALARGMGSARGLGEPLEKAFRDLATRGILLPPELEREAYPEAARTFCSQPGDGYVCLMMALHLQERARAERWGSP